MKRKQFFDQRDTHFFYKHHETGICARDGESIL